MDDFWNNGFDPYQALLQLNSNQQQLDHNLQMMVENQDHLMAAVNNNNRSVKMLLQQNQQLHQLLAMTRQELHDLQLEIYHLSELVKNGGINS